MPAERFAKMFRAEDMKLPDTWGKVDLKTVPKDVCELAEGVAASAAHLARLLKQDGYPGREPSHSSG